jgi:uncharacterized membrane protein
MTNSQVSGTQASATGAAGAASDDMRTLAIIAYALYFGFFVAGITPLIGATIAYVKRGDAHGTIWESHFDNLITVFWMGLAICLLLIPVWIFVLGTTILAAVAAWPASLFTFPFILVLLFFPFSLLVLAWYLYRTIKGFVRALDNKPYV